jgi:localization factor PodJL
MKFGFPWNVKGIRQHAQQTAQEAARRAGMPLSDWLNAIILQQAATQGIRVPSLPRSIDEGTADHLTGVHQRLDDLTRRIDQVTRSGSAPYAPKRDREEPDQFAELFARLEQRFEQFAAKIPRPSTPHAADNIYPPGLVSAIAEIAARHRPLHAAPAQDLSGLEGQLRRITDQIETLRRPGVEEAIAALHVELREISHTLAEAMPRRAIETIEIQIQRLTQRLADGRQAGVDGNALAGIEYGLAEVRDALHALTPAENLVGYTDAIDALRHKIDLIVAQKDPATMQRLETSIGALREMAAHVASNEAMSGLYAQVQALADKIDHLAISGGSDALNRLELRIDALSRTLADRAQSGDIPPRLEVLMQSLSEKIEQLQPLRGDQIAVGHLEDRIVRLFERLDATDSRLSQLDAVERGLTDLLVHIEDIRVNKETAGLRAESAPDIDLLRQDIARTHGALEAVNGTLDRVADRLTVIEGDIRDSRPGPAIREPDVLELMQFSDKAATQEITVGPEIAPRPQPNSPLAISVPVKAPQPALPLSVVFPNLGLRPVASAPSDSDLPVDVPLEPGSRRPGPAQSPGMRIAASEAALGGVQPNMATAGGKSNFIAAARRAAQAAGQDPNGRQRSEPLKAKGGEQGSLRTRVQTRVKTLFLAASIVAIIIGSIQFASNIFDFGIFNTREARLATASEMDAANSEIAADTAELETSAALAESQPTSPTTPADTDIIASLLAPPPLPSLAPATPPPPVATAPPSLNLNSAEQLSSALNLPMLSPSLLGPTPKGDVTGSIVPAPADTRSNRQPAQTAQPPAADGLPAAIGGARLRNAASAGDPAAAYEIAMRFVEGRGVPTNLEEAARWFERAANKGLAPAQFRYASMLEKGLGVKKDLVVAHKLYVAAAGKGHAKAMHNLAVLYAEGAEGKPDYVNAAQWFRKAAERGVADSQFNLGVLTVRGLGTEKNIAESYKWFALAAAQGDRDAGRKRDEVAGYLNAEILAAAQEAVKSFAAKPQPAEATMVPQPSGGWDRATSPPPEKPRAAGPLSISAFNSGKL